MTLTDWQFELGGIEFGVGQAVAVSKFERGGPEVRDQDKPAGWGDWVNFGTDRKTPGLWTWELVTNLSDATSALAAMEQLETAWDAEDIRVSPGAAMPLRYRVNGRTRRVYGRPRRFSSTPQELTRAGRVHAVADFQPAEAVSYDDAEDSVTLSLSAANLNTGGLTFPVTFPALWGGTAGNPGSRNIIVAGSRPTWLTAVITGPVTNPYLLVDGRLLQLIGAVPTGQANRITMSALPWARGVYRTSDSTQVSAYLEVDSRLDAARVAPGGHLLTFGGIDNTGTASCVVSWRNAHNGH